MTNKRRTLEWLSWGVGLVMVYVVLALITSWARGVDAKRNACFEKEVFSRNYETRTTEGYAKYNTALTACKVSYPYHSHWVAWLESVMPK